MKTKICLVLAVIVMACSSVPGQQYDKFAQAQRANAEALREYNWWSRTEVRKDGETKSVRLYLMSYDLDGTIRQSLISGSQPQQIPTRGLRGLVAKKKKEEFVETLDGLGALARTYGNLAPAELRSFMAGAAVTPEASARQSLLRIEGGDVLRPGDSMTIWVDALTRRQRRVEVRTSYDGKPVRIVSEFRDVPKGPTYMARSVVEYPSRELSITTENFDYERER